MSYRITLTSQSPLLIGGQFDNVYVDHATARENGFPFIPASAIKGAMRIEFERLARAAETASQPLGDEPVCLGPDAQTMCASDHMCIACKLFGSPGRWTGLLRFGDASVLTDDFASEAYVSRTNVTISRQLKRAEPRRLFSYEAAPAMLEFHGEIRTLGPMDPNVRQILERVFAWWKDQGIAIGSGKSRGLGKLGFASEWLGGEPARDTGTFARDEDEVEKIYRLTFMPEKRISGETTEPLRLGTVQKRQFFLGSLGFIPGSTTRGAAGWAMRNADISSQICDDFLEGQQTLFSHLYPTAFADLRPASAVECRLHGRDNHPVFDTLLLQYALTTAMAQLPGDLDIITRLSDSLSHCSLPLGTAIRCGGKLKPAPFMPAGARSLQIKLGLDRTLGHARDGMFYIYESAGSSSGFHGLARATPSAAEALNSIGGEVYMGGARSKGFGAGRLTLTPEYDHGAANQIVDRLQRLAVAANVLFETCRLPIPNSLLVSITCITDVAPTQGCSPEKTILDALGLPNTVVVAASAAWEWMGGWSQAANRQKPLMQVLKRGSALLLCIEESMELETLAGRLAELESQGVGMGREYGFGWVSVALPFHYERCITPDGGDHV